jgi:tetratricopeptide (TPR) repeat protein
VKTWKGFDIGWRLALIAAMALGAVVFSAAHAQQSKSRSRNSKTATKSPKPAAPPAPANELADEAGPSLEGIRANNVGVALMDQRNYPQAVGRFQTACIMVPDSDTGCLNAGIALLAMQQYDEARKILTTSVARDSQDTRAWYNLGLLNRTQGYTDLALQDFQKVAALDPDDAATQCLIGLTYESEGDFKRALAAFQQGLQLDPLSAAAESGIADALAKTGDAEGEKTHLDRYRHLTGSGISLPIGENYGQQGKYSLAAEIPPPQTVPPAIAVHFVDVTRLAGLAPPIRVVRSTGHSGGRGPHARQSAAAKPAPARAIRSMADFLGSGACVFDYDGDGRPDIFLVDADGDGDAALYHNLGHGRFADVTKASKIRFHEEGMGCAVGDYDNDGHPDLAVSFNGGVRLFHNEGNGTFADVTAASGIRADGLVLGLSFLDYDRDGRLDLYVTRFRDFPLPKPSQPFAWPDDAANNEPRGNILWKNNGDGTFSDATAALGLAGDASATGAIASDFTGDGAPDLLLTGVRPTPALLLNPREGAFKAASPWGAETQGPTAGGVAFDFDKDGWMDIALTHWQPTTLGLWRSAGGKTFERVAVPDPGWMRAWGIAPLDYDNDGWIDLVAVGETFSGEGRIALLRNEGGKGFHDVTAQTGLDKIALQDPRSVIAFDADGDGSVELLITQSHRPPVLLRAVGANVHNWAEIGLKGNTDNAMGMGVSVEMYSDALRQTWEVPGASGYLSQGPATISAGLGDQEQADAVRIRWRTGPAQVKMPLGAQGKTLISQGDRNTPP